MPIAKVPINELPWQNLDSIAIGDSASVLINGYLDKSPQGKNVTMERPGFYEFCDLETNEQVDGVYRWSEESLTIAVSNGNVYLISDTGVKSLLGTGLRVGERVNFRPYFNAADNKNYLFMANGGSMFYTDGIVLNEMADPNAPKYVTNIDVIDTILIANDYINGEMRYTDPLNPFIWPPLNSIRPDTLGDTMQALIIANRHVYLLGRISTDTFYSAGDQIPPFARMDGMFSDVGIGAIGSLAKLDIATVSLMSAYSPIFFLDSRRFVISLVGNTPNYVSKGIDVILQSFDRVDDAVGHIIKVNSKLFYLLTFPSENRTFVYDIELKCWYEWATWDDKLAVYNALPWKDITYNEAIGMYIAGSWEDGKLYLFDRRYLDDDGDAKRIVKITGHVDHGNYNYKVCKRLTVHCKRGFNDVSTGRVTDESGIKMKDENGNWIVPDMSTAEMEGTCQLQIRYQDTNMTGWSNAITVSIRNNGFDDAIFRINRLGMYRERQYEFTYSGATPFIFVDAEEELEQLSR